MHACSGWRPDASISRSFGGVALGQVNREFDANRPLVHFLQSSQCGTHHVNEGLVATQTVEGQGDAIVFVQNGRFPNRFKCVAMIERRDLGSTVMIDTQRFQDWHGDDFVVGCVHDCHEPLRIPALFFDSCFRTQRRMAQGDETRVIL